MITVLKYVEGNGKKGGNKTFAMMVKTSHKFKE